MIIEKPASRNAIVIAAATAIIGIAVTSALGIWQLKRLAWKEALLARIEQRANTAPVSLQAALGAAASGENIEYLRVRIHGAYIGNDDLHYYALGPAGPGWNVITPFRVDDGALLLIDRGFVPDRAKAEISMPPSGPLALTGRVRNTGRKGMFDPDNDPADNQWYWRDIPAMVAALANSTDDGDKALVDFILAEEPASTTPASKAAVSSSWPRPGSTRPDIPNNHLQYAFTWFAFATILAAIFLLWLAKQRRLRLAAAADQD